MRNPRDRAGAGAARAREVDEAGGVGEARVAGAAGPLRRPARQLRVLGALDALRSCLAREAQEDERRRPGERAAPLQASCSVNSLCYLTTDPPRPA